MSVLNLRASAAYKLARQESKTTLVDPSTGFEKWAVTRLGMLLKKELRYIGPNWYSYWLFVPYETAENYRKARNNMMFPPLPGKSAVIAVDDAYKPKIPFGMVAICSCFCGALSAETPDFANDSARWCRRGGPGFPGKTGAHDGNAPVSQRWGDHATMVVTTLLNGDIAPLFFLTKSSDLIKGSKWCHELAKTEKALMGAETSPDAAELLYRLFEYDPAIIWDKIWEMLGGNPDISQRSLGIPSHIFMMGLLACRKIHPKEVSTVALRMMLERCLDKCEAPSEKKLDGCNTLNEVAELINEHIVGSSLHTFKGLVLQFLFVQGWRENPRMPFAAFNEFIEGIRKVVSEANSFIELVALVDPDHPLAKADNPDIILADCCYRHLSNRGMKADRVTFPYEPLVSHSSPDKLIKRVEKNLERVVRRKREEAKATEKARALMGEGEAQLKPEPGNVCNALSGDFPKTHAEMVAAIVTGNIPAITTGVQAARRNYHGDGWYLRMLAVAVAHSGDPEMTVPLPDGRSILLHASVVLNLGFRAVSAKRLLNPVSVYDLEENLRRDAAAAVPHPAAMYVDPEVSETAIRWKAFKADHHATVQKDLAMTMARALISFECCVCFEVFSKGAQYCVNKHPPYLCEGCASRLESCPLCRGVLKNPS